MVKILPRNQAQHEAGILHSLARHPKARAITVLCELPLPGDSAALVMPLVPHRLFEKATPEVVLHQWLQLCEVPWTALLAASWPCPNTAHPETVYLFARHGRCGLGCACVARAKESNAGVDAHGDVVLFDAGASERLKGGSVTVCSPTGTPRVHVSGSRSC